LRAQPSELVSLNSSFISGVQPRRGALEEAHNEEDFSRYRRCGDDVRSGRVSHGASPRRWLKAAAYSIDLTEKTVVYIVDGRRYSFYFDGWNGPGWYRCGYAWRRGPGWGGLYGYHAPYIR
jgi:hypothetical protein